MDPSHVQPWGMDTVRGTSAEEREPILPLLFLCGRCLWVSIEDGLWGTLAKRHLLGNEAAPRMAGTLRQGRETGSRVSQVARVRASHFKVSQWDQWSSSTLHLCLEP